MPGMTYSNMYAFIFLLPGVGFRYSVNADWFSQDIPGSLILTVTD